MYGLTIAIGIIISIFLAEKLCKNKNLDPQIFWECSFWVILAGVIGARAWHVIDLWEVYSVNFPAVFMVWNGGLSIFGAIPAGILTAVIFLKSKGQNAFEWLDIFAVSAPLGQAIGRWGNYFNKELLPFAVYESITNLVSFVIVFMIFRKKMKPGVVMTVYLIDYVLIRIFLQPFRYN